MTETLISVLKAVSDELADEADLASLMDFDDAAEETEEALSGSEEEAKAYLDHPVLGAVTVRLS